jgi:hypothetical protein
VCGEGKQDRNRRAPRDTWQLSGYRGDEDWARRRRLALWVLRHNDTRTAQRSCSTDLAVQMAPEVLSALDSYDISWDVDVHFVG